MRKIEIDLDVHKAIEVARRSFEDTENSVLRRLLGIDQRADVSPKSIGIQRRGWAGKGASLPYGTELRMDYNGREHRGTISDGYWLVEGKQFKSPSAAARGVALTRDGKHTQLNGWKKWEVRRPGETQWILLDKLHPDGIVRPKKRRHGGPPLTLDDLATVPSDEQGETKANSAAAQ